MASIPILISDCYQVPEISYLWLVLLNSFKVVQVKYCDFICYPLCCTYMALGFLQSDCLLYAVQLIVTNCVIWD